MKKASTDLLLCPLMLESSPHTYTCIEVKFMTGVHVVIHKSLLSVTDNASGSLPDADPFNSTYQSQAISSCATASLQLILLSAMEPISISIDGLARTTEVSGASLESYHSGPPFHTGCLPSTSEELSRGERTMAICGWIEDLSTESALIISFLHILFII
jgi:hypothetical protein